MLSQRSECGKYFCSAPIRINSSPDETECHKMDMIYVQLMRRTRNRSNLCLRTWQSKIYLNYSRWDSFRSRKTDESSRWHPLLRVFRWRFLGHCQTNDSVENLKINWIYWVFWPLNKSQATNINHSAYNEMINRKN